MNKEEHAGKHDLESIFYALLYALTTFKGPAELRTKQDFIELSSRPPVLDWFEINVLRSSFNKLACTKIGHLFDFEKGILKKMDPYFNGLRPFLRTLFNATFPDGPHRSCHLSHDMMINLFDVEYKRLLALEEKEEKVQEDEMNPPKKRARTD
jgi:hypothetical protein